MTDPEVLRIANCSGFYGDRMAAAREMIDGGPIDVLTGDWLAELTMLILAKDQLKNPDGGYAKTFVAQVADVLGDCLDRGIKIVSNAGGLNPAGCAAAVQALADEAGLSPKIAYVHGDNIVGRLGELGPLGVDLANIDTGEKLDEVGVEPLTANAYLGAWGIVEALGAGADIVITGRVTDAAVIVGPAAWHFGWARTDWDELAAAVVAGHIIECGTQCTGGNYAFFQDVPGLERPGFPIAEVRRDGSFVVTKHPGTGGLVSVGTITAQLLYEIQGLEYYNPDATVRLNSIRVEQDGPDRVLVHSVRGLPGPATTKVAINYLGGYRNSMTLVMTGLDVEAKAELAERTLWSMIPGGRDSFEAVDVRLRRTDRDDPTTNDDALAELRITVMDRDEAKVGRPFSNAVIEMVLASYPGFFTTSPPSRAASFGVYWPALVPADFPHHEVVLGDVRLPIAPAPTQPPALDQRTPRRTPTGPEGETGTKRPKTAPMVSNHPETIAELLDDLSRRRLAAGAGDEVYWDDLPADRAPLGRVIGARSGDKGGNANVGLWAPNDDAYDWLAWYLTVDRLRALCPAETEGLDVERHDLPNLRALNFVIRGLLGRGVAASTRTDGQAKGLAEYVRAKWVDIPTILLDAGHGDEAQPLAATSIPAVRARPEPSPPGDPMQFTAEHDQFRQMVRDIVDKEINPHADAWEEAGIFPAHELFPKLGAAGIFGLEYDPAYGGQGADHIYTMIYGEEMGRCATGGVAMAVSVQTDMATPALHSFGSHELKDRYLRPALAGEMVAAIAVTEPDAGSDVANIRTRAVADGDEWVINGTKLYITSGTQADWLCLLARTSDEGGYRGMSQIVVPTDAPGFSVSRKLDKLGQRSSDTAELSFVDMRVPMSNTIGEVGRGFQQQMDQFQNERLIAAYMASGALRDALDRTIEYVKQRGAFGKTLADNQWIQFKLAELVAEVDLVIHYNRACAEAIVNDADPFTVTKMASIAKLKTGRLQREVSDWAMQFHGGIGYMEETWTARYYRDARLLSIGGGADEVMLRIIAQLEGIGKA